MAELPAILAIETSGRVGGVGVYRFDPSGECRSASEVTFERGILHGAAVTPSLRRVLKDSGCVGPALALVCVSAGPGSWTGLRIGVTAAKSLAYAWKVPVCGVSSLEALALEAADVFGAPAASRALVPVRDAKRDEFFFALFDRLDGALVRTSADQALPAEEFARRLPPGAIVFGDVAALRKKLDALRFPAGVELREAPAHAGPPRAARLGWRALAEGRVLRSPEEIHAFAPAYLKLSHPELKLQERGR